jgi:hypothetical protein
LTWLQPLGLTRDNQAWTYNLSDGLTTYRFPVSVTQVISQVTKTPEQMARIMALKDTWEPRGNTVHLALEHFVHHRWNPETTYKTPISLTSEPYATYQDWIDPLLVHPLWDRITPVGSEVMAYCLKRNVAGTFDLVFRFADGTYGLADLKTQSSASSQPYDIRPQLGAGVHMVGDRYGIYLTRCLGLWARPGGLTVQTYKAQECLDAWFDVLEQYEARFRPF